MDSGAAQVIPASDSGSDGFDERLQTALDQVCEIAKYHGLPGRITPSDFAIQHSTPGRTRATYVDQRYVITVMVYPDHLAYSFGEAQWIDHGTRKAPPKPRTPAAAQHPRGICPECRGSYQLRADGRIRAHRGMYAGHSRTEAPWQCPGVGRTPVRPRRAKSEETSHG